MSFDSLSRKLDRLQAAAEGLRDDPAVKSQLLHDELFRRLDKALEGLFTLTPEDMVGEVWESMQAGLDARDDIFEAGGVWDWLVSLAWCHSTLPEGLTEEAVRENVRRFMRYGGCAQLTFTCWGCGLATPAPWADDMTNPAWKERPPEPCAFCGGDDLVPIFGQRDREPRPWQDNWAYRVQFGTDPPEGSKVIS
jgi:hypothetical protein